MQTERRSSCGPLSSGPAATVGVHESSGSWAAPDLTPWHPGDLLENPVTGERAIVTALPWSESDGRAAAEMTARAGAAVVGEHRHPSLVERFTVLDGELTVSLDGHTHVRREGEASEVQPGHWHDRWNASDRDVRVLVEVTPGERFVHMIETLFGLARTGHTDAEGRPDPLQLAMFGREFVDTVQFKSPPVVLQRAMFAALSPLAHAMGYRGSQAIQAVVYPGCSKEGWSVSGIGRRMRGIGRRVRPPDRRTRPCRCALREWMGRPPLALAAHGHIDFHTDPDSGRVRAGARFRHIDGVCRPVTRWGADRAQAEGTVHRIRPDHLTVTLAEISRRRRVHTLVAPPGFPERAATGASAELVRRVVS